MDTRVVIILALATMMSGLFIKFVSNIGSQMKDPIQDVTDNSNGTVDSSSNSDFVYSYPNTNNKTISIVQYKGNTENLIIPHYRKIGSVCYKITGISANAFNGNTSVKQVTIPDSVTSIGAWAFGHSALTSVDIPASVKSIGYYAFAHTFLTRVDVPASVTSIAEGTFSQDYNLKSLTLGSDVTSIGAWAFENTALTRIDLPASLKSIGDWAFNYTNLKSLILGSNVTSIGEGAFAHTALTRVDFPASLKSIRETAFYGTPISAISFKKPVDLGGSAFRSTTLALVTLPTGSTYHTCSDLTFEPHVNVMVN